MTHFSPSEQARKRVVSPFPKRKYRVYSDEERARAIALLFANGNNLRRTAKQLDLPVTTLRVWAREGVKPANPDRVLEVASSLEAKLEKWIDQVLCIHPTNFPLNSFLEHVKAIEVLVNMVLALRQHCTPIARLREEPVTIDSQRDTPPAAAVDRSADQIIHLDKLTPTQADQLLMILDRIRNGNTERHEKAAVCDSSLS